MTIESMALGGASLIAQEIYSNEDVRGYLSRLMHLIYKRIFYADVETIILEDCIRNVIQLNLGDDFVLLNGELTLRAMQSQDENDKMLQLKAENYNLYIMKYKKHMKTILNAMREQHKDKTIVLLLSSQEMANALHIKKHIQVYQMSDKLYDEAKMKLQTDKERQYVEKQRKRLLDKAKFKYESIDQLQEHLNNQFA